MREDIRQAPRSDWRQPIRLRIMRIAAQPLYDQVFGKQVCCVSACEGERREPGETAQRDSPFGRRRGVLEDAAVADIALPAFEFEASAQQQLGVFQLSRRGVERIEKNVFGYGTAANDPAIERIAAKNF